MAEGGGANCQGCVHGGCRLGLGFFKKWEWEEDDRYYFDGFQNLMG